MYWLYFARDFYRARPSSQAKPVVATSLHCSDMDADTPALAAVNAHPAFSSHDTEPMQHTTIDTALSDSYEALFAEHALHSHASHSYLQRMGVEGDLAFAVWDKEAGFSMFSANFERVTGVITSECAGHDWIHAVHTDQQYSMNEALLNAQAGHHGRCLVQLCSRHESEGWRWVMVDVRARSAQQPNIMVFWRDLSEQKALEETLKQVESTLAMSERGRSAFLSSMSHELRTPLNAIMGFSQMMNQGVFGPLTNPTYAEYAKHIQESGETLLGKVNDLLDIASMNADGLELEESVFSLPTLLMEAMEIHSHLAFTRGIQIQLDCPHAIEVNADRAKMLCSVSHMLANAVRHSMEKGQIQLSVRVQLDDGIIISVRDHGEGITAVQLDEIRQALEAENSYFSIASGGIGLGLSLTRELAQRHGGRIMIDSIRHRGTVVSLILPMERAVRGVPARKRNARAS